MTSKSRVQRSIRSPERPLGTVLALPLSSMAGSAMFLQGAHWWSAKCSERSLEEGSTDCIFNPLSAKIHNLKCCFPDVVKHNLPLDDTIIPKRVTWPEGIITLASMLSLSNCHTANVGRSAKAAFFYSTSLAKPILTSNHGSGISVVLWVHTFQTTRLRCKCSDYWQMLLSLFL